MSFGQSGDQESASLTLLLKFCSYRASEDAHEAHQLFSAVMNGDDHPKRADLFAHLRAEASSALVETHAG